MFINRFNCLFLLILGLFQLAPLLVHGSEIGKTRFFLELIVNAREGAETYGDWLDNYPASKKAKQSLKRWLSDHQILHEKVEAIRYQKADVRFAWISEDDKNEMSLNLISLHPLIFRLNGIEAKIEFANPTPDYIYRRLEKIHAKQKVSWLWDALIPQAQAKKKSFLKKLALPLMLLSLVSLPFTISYIKGNFDKVDELEKRYDNETKSIADTKDRVTKAQENPNSPYSVSHIECKSVKGAGRPNVFANPGEDGYVSYGLDKIRLKPKGKIPGDSELEITYSNDGGQRQIKEIKFRRRPSSNKPEDLYKNDCLLYAASIKDPRSRFLNQCVKEAFPDRAITTLPEFYSNLGNFSLKDYEAMAATEPGCLQILSWITGGPPPPPSTPDASKSERTEQSMQNK